MKTKYLIPAVIATAFGSSVALADTYGTYHQNSWDSSHSSQMHRDARMNDDVGTGEGYTLQQLREAGRGGNADENPQYLSQEELRDSPQTAINAGTISIGDGTAQP